MPIDIYLMRREGNFGDLMLYGLATSEFMGKNIESVGRHIHDDIQPHAQGWSVFWIRWPQCRTLPRIAFRRIAYWSLALVNPDFSSGNDAGSGRQSLGIAEDIAKRRLLKLEVIGNFYSNPGIHGFHSEGTFDGERRLARRHLDDTRSWL